MTTVPVLVVGGARNFFAAHPVEPASRRISRQYGTDPMTVTTVPGGMHASGSASVS